MHYHNPIIPGFHPDPSICRAGDDYFLVNSSFEYFPGVPLFHSRDLVNWRQIGYCLTRESQLPLERAWISGGIFAPTIRYHNGTFYMVTTNTTHGGNFYVSAGDPFGAWSEPVWVDLDAIDPDLFFDNDGTVYLTSSGRSGGRCRIVQSTIDIASGKHLTAERDIWNGTGGKGPEGPHLYHIDGRYYLMIAEGGTEYGHMEVIARGDSPSGPWNACPRNPILTHRSIASPIQATGHADLVQAADGSWWMVCLGIRPVGYHDAHHLGRETFLAPVRWDRDGWPVVGGSGLLGLEMDAPGTAVQVRPRGATRDDFDSRDLGLCWNFVKNPLPGYWSLTERPGWLCLHGPAAGIDNVYPAPCLVGRRQQHFSCVASVLLDFEPARDGEEAGLVVWQNMRHHYEIAVTRTGGVRCAIVRRRIGSLQATVAQTSIPEGLVLLSVTADPATYRFAYGVPGGTPVELAQGESRYLSTEVGGLFTGVFLATYATGNGAPSQAVAAFDWFEYEGRGD